MSPTKLDPAKAEAARILLADAPSMQGNAQVDWWRLITETEGLRASTGLGMLGVWEHIRDGDYARARAALDQHAAR